MLVCIYDSVYTSRVDIENVASKLNIGEFVLKMRKRRNNIYLLNLEVNTAVSI